MKSNKYKYECSLNYWKQNKSLLFLSNCSPHGLKNRPKSQNSYFLTFFSLKLMWSCSSFIEMLQISWYRFELDDSWYSWTTYIHASIPFFLYADMFSPIIMMVWRKFFTSVQLLNYFFAIWPSFLIFVNLKDCNQSVYLWRRHLLSRFLFYCDVHLWPYLAK